MQLQKPNGDLLSIESDGVQARLNLTIGAGQLSVTAMATAEELGALQAYADHLGDAPRSRVRVDFTTEPLEAWVSICRVGADAFLFELYNEINVGEGLSPLASTRLHGLDVAQIASLQDP